uniref:Uncharacterized protein n=1 Tax=Vitrella brassicaformis TaxID=1169539 RepID=A0A7S1P363_9ALVE|mmetsp:Transcript_28492/g.71152  ORF Transcript_28492/g.71152 Transcript_28492/m.71152 type:complete len:106 (+) Transcript_28492:37-354(+)
MLTRLPTSPSDHSRVCEDKSIYFTALCVTVDGVWGREASGSFSRLVEKVRPPSGCMGRQVVCAWGGSVLGCLCVGVRVCVVGGSTGRRLYARRALRTVLACLSCD